MQLPLQIAFRNMKPSEEIETLVRERAIKLDTFADHIMSCRVVVEPKGKHRRHGNLYDVRIDVTVPGEVILATRLPDDRPLNTARFRLRCATPSMPWTAS